MTVKSPSDTSPKNAGSGSGSVLSGPAAEATMDEKKLFVTWERFKPDDTDTMSMGLCKTVAFLLRHVTGTGYVWVEFASILKKACGLWPGMNQSISEDDAFAMVKKQDNDEVRPRFTFKTEEGKQFIRALQQTERITKPAKELNTSEPLKVFQGADMVGYCNPDTINRRGRIWN